ncbi:MAG: efflux RND transporter permease subunit [Ichthyobacteriaceae bacterium]|nr:efflux RND transporter permease subunit [Ichthyobacteriaceae bacterium]
MKKDFKLSSFSIDNRTTVLVLTFIIFITGLSAYLSMPREAFPEVITPTIYITTPYPGNSPLDIEKLITRPIEKEVNGITGIDDITSTSVQGFSMIVVEFDFSITPEEALRKVKDKVDRAKSDKDFPTDLPADPDIFEMNISELMPIMNINLSGHFTMSQLQDYAEYLEDKIEGLSEITKVEIRGIQDKEVEISVDKYKMESLEISFGDIAQAIQYENMTISGGDLVSGGLRRNVRVVGEINDIEDFGKIIIKRENQEVVYLKDIAEIAFKEKEIESIAREYGKPVVMLDVMKRSGENLIIASHKINEILDKAKTDKFPSNLSISITNDMSFQTKMQVDELENSIIMGMLLVVGVLMFFLGFRNALFVGVAIPLSMLLSFIILNSLGVTLNTMVLFSLVMALGMLVDNGIVVVENVYRHMSEGLNPIEAAKEGVGEVAWPIIASTATTLAAFVPLALWPGMMGEFMKYLPITLIIVLSSSLFVALVINPVLTALFMKLEESPMSKKSMIIITVVLVVVGLIVVLLGLTSSNKSLIALGNILLLSAILFQLQIKFINPATDWFQNKFMPKLEKVYSKSLKVALKGKNPKRYLFGTFGLLIVSVIIFGIFTPKVEFFPSNEPNQAFAYIEYPIGTDIELTNEITKELEQKVINVVKQYEVEETDENENTEAYNYMVKAVISQIGAGAGDPNQGMSLGATPNKSKISVEFRESSARRGVSSKDVVEQIRQALKGYAGLTVSVTKDQNGPPTGAAINIELKGDDYVEVLAEAEKVRHFINKLNIDGIDELKIDVDRGKPEMPIEVDRAKARRFNLSTAQIGDAVRTSIYGKEVSTYKFGEDNYPINIRLQKKYRTNESAIMDQFITFRDQATGRIAQVPISAVAKATKTSTFSSVKRKDLDRLIKIYSGVTEGANANEIVEEIKYNLKDYKLPEGVVLQFTGQQEEQAKEMAFLSNALLVAVFMIFLIIVAQFNSVSTPVIIVSSVVLSLIGVLLGLVIFRMPFIIIMTMIGIVSLAGIVVNNAIVLIDYTNLLESSLKDKLKLTEKQMLTKTQMLDIIVEGGEKRLRPVLLTAITTILGLLPLATGMNLNFFTAFTDYDPQLYFGGDNMVFWGPMSWAIIFGLTFATFLTLIIVPVMYFLIFRLKLRLNKRKITIVSNS